MPPSRSSSYLPQLDGLRAIAVLAVFLSHAFHIPYLWAGVDLFFILSGYLITNILVRDREHLSFSRMLGRFYLRRAERILPAYIAFLMLCYLTLNIDWSHTWPYYIFFCQNIPYAFGFFPSSLLVPLWSLAIEQHFYLLWPGIVFFLPRRWLPWMMGALLVVEPIVRALCTPLFSKSEAIYSLTPFRLDAMAAGALAALLLPHCNAEQTVRAAKWVMISASGMLLWLGGHTWYRRVDNNALFNSTAYSFNILILGSIFVCAVLAQQSLFARLLSHPLLRGLGRVSYMFYLLHLYVLALIGTRLGKVLSPLAAFALTSLLASLSWFIIEKPILSLSASHRFGGQRSPMAS